MVSNDGINYQTVAALDDITDGPNRVIGMGWEVINTTPEMYKSGSILTYQCPWLPADTGSAGYYLVAGHSGMVGIDGYTSGSMVNRVMQAAQVLPTPYDSTSATTLPSSKQWDAGHGLYCVPRLSQFDGPFTYGGQSGAFDVWSAVLKNDPGEFAIYSSNVDKIYSKFRGGQVDAKGGQPCVLNDTQWLNFYRSDGSIPPQQEQHNLAFGGACLSGYTATGAHLTGLSPESTFTVVLTYYVQILPGSKSPLISSIRPSTPYDPRAYQIYTTVMQRLPIGCFKDDNDFGDWFRKAMRLISQVAPLVGAAFGPVGALVGKGVGAAGTAAEKVTEAIQARKRKTRQPSRRTQQTRK